MKDRKGEGFLGLLLLIVGGLFLANNIVDIEISAYLINWKTLVILFGAFLFIGGDDKTFGAIVMTFGGLANYADYIGVTLGSVLGDYWPVFLIIAGLGGIFKSIIPANKSKDDNRVHWEKKHNEHDCCKTKEPRPVGSYTPNDRDVLEDFILFRTVEEANGSQNFRGGKLTCIFAGMELDLRTAQLQAGKNVLEVFIAFAGVELIVPPDWKVVTNTTVAFGGIDDQRHRSSGENVDQEKILEIRGTIIFGGLELKN